MENNYIKELINTAYREHRLIQNPTEIYNFAKFYSELNCKNVLEIGTFFGGTFYLLCKLSDDTGKKVSVDFPFPEAPGGIDVANNLHTIVPTIKKFSSNVDVLTMDSHSPDTLKTVEEIFNGEEVDFIFIDGDHSYEGVKADYQMYKHLLKDGGYIGFHDINHYSRVSPGCMVDLFWQELSNDPNVIVREFNQHGLGGIGVVQVFKHKRKLDISVSFEAPSTIHLTNNSHDKLDLLVSIRDKHTKIPIYFCDINYSGPGQAWFIQPIGSHNWVDEPYLNTFLIEFYDKDKNFIDSKELKIKEDRISFDSIGTRHFSAFDCLWINYKQMFLDKIYDRFDLDNLNTVIDIGANVGIFTQYMASKNARTIHAIEPTGKAFEELKKQVYYYNGVKCHKIGIDTVNEYKTIYTNIDNTTLSSFLQKTSDNIQEESVQMFTLPTFYSNNNIDKVDLVKMDIEGMEYGIMNGLSDSDIVRCKRYLIEYHSNETGNADRLIERLQDLGYDIDIRPDVPSNVQGHFFAILNGSPKFKVKPSTTDVKFPERAFVTFTNEYYLPLTEQLVKSIHKNSEYPIIVYSVNCDVNFSYPRLYTKRIDSDFIRKPEFLLTDKVLSRKDDVPVEVHLPKDSMGLVDRNNIDTYITLTRKPMIILDAMEHGLREGIFLDADGIAKENIDTAFNHLSECGNYPLVGEGLFEYMMLNGLGDPEFGPSLEQPLMDLLGVPNRTMYYVSTNFILFTDRMKPFIQEWATVADNKTILENNVKYAPYHDETIMNVLLWKYNANKKLPLVHYNLTNAQKAYEFYTTDKREAITDSEWHYIPKDINDIKYFHGCKSVSEIERTLGIIDHFKNNKDGFKYKFHKIKTSHNAKIAIVTLFDSYYTDLARVSIPNKINYAKQHGYDLIYFEDKIDDSRPAQWSKVKAIEFALKEYEWVWWIDIDALIMNNSIRLEDIIDNNADIIFTENKYSVISNGSSFFKNTQLTRDFLKECYDLDRDILRNIDVSTFDHEQKPMRELYLHVPKYREKIKLVHERVCNSYCRTTNESVLASYPNWNSEDNIYQLGDFVINFCGRTKEERMNIMGNFSNILSVL